MTTIRLLLLAAVAATLAPGARAQTNEQLQKQFDELKRAVELHEAEARAAAPQDAAPPTALAGSPGPAGATGPVPTNLDQMIATALRASPEVLLAEAKLRQAQAELNQARLKVTRELVSAFNEKKARQSGLLGAERNLAMTTKLHQQGSTGASDVEVARAKLGEAELGIAQADAEIRYLLGVGSLFDPTQLRESAGPAAPRQLPNPRAFRIPEALTEPLARQVTVKFDKTTMEDVVNTLASQANVSMVIDQQVGFDLTNPITLSLNAPVAFSAVLRALADQNDLVFILRDYGILVTNEGRAVSLRGPTIPDATPMRSDAK
jgi:hypothetical protein